MRRGRPASRKLGPRPKPGTRPPKGQPKPPLPPQAPDYAVNTQASVPPPTTERVAKRLSLGAAAALVVITLLLQSYLPLYIPVVGSFDLPLLCVIYLALMSRNVPQGILIGVVVGLAQDSLTHGPIGVFGIIKTLIGYLASSISLVIETDYPGARSVLVALFLLIHQLIYWIMQRVLLGTDASFNPALTLVLAAAHAALSLLVFRLFDGLKRAG